MKRFLRLPAVKDRTAWQRSTVYARINEGLFPRPVALGARAVGWLESEVDTMIAARVRGASDDDLRALVQQLEADRKQAA